MPDGYGQSIWCRCIKGGEAGFDWSREWRPLLRVGESANPKIVEERVDPSARGFCLLGELGQQN